MRRVAASPPAFRLPPRRALPPRATLPRVGFSASFWAQTLGMVFALAVVVISIFVVLRWVSSKMHALQGMQGRLLSVTSRISLEPKKGVWILEAAGSFYLVATHDQGVTLLDKLDAAAVRAVLEGEEPESKPFWKAFAATASQPQDGTAPPENPVPTHFEVISDGTTTTSHSDTENNDAQESSES